MKKLVLVDSLVQYRMRHVIEVEDVIEHALDEFVMMESDVDFIEFSQKNLLPSVIISHREITQEEYLKLFDEDNDYLKGWSEEHKLNWINKIDYSK